MQHESTPEALFAAAEALADSGSVECLSVSCWRRRQSDNGSISFGYDVAHQPVGQED